MKYKTAITLASTLLLFNACSSSKTSVRDGGYYHSSIYFGKNFSASYKQGITDGCATAKGDYKKSHTHFNTDKNYKDGWFLGRNRCRSLLIVEE